MENVEMIMYSRGVSAMRKKFKKETIKLKKNQDNIVETKNLKKPTVTLKNFPSVVSNVEESIVKPKVLLKKQSDVKKKTTVIIKRTKCDLPEEKDLPDLPDLPDLCNKIENVCLELLYSYYISSDNIVVDSSYKGEKRLCFRKSNNLKKVTVLDEPTREEIKKTIPTKFLNLFHRLKKYHIMDCYGSNTNKIDAWNSLSLVSKQRWQSIALSTQEICNALLNHHGIESMLLWASLFS